MCWPAKRRVSVELLSMEVIGSTLVSRNIKFSVSCFIVYIMRLCRNIYSIAYTVHNYAFFTSRILYTTDDKETPLYQSCGSQCRCVLY